MTIDTTHPLDGQPVAPYQPSSRRRLRRAAVAATVLVLVVVTAAVGWGVRRYRQFDFVDVPGVDRAGAGQASNWLIVGTDSREGIEADDSEFMGDAETVSGQRADTIMVARIDPASGAVDLLSIPRDLWVPVAGRTDGGEGRINGAFNGPGGRERLVATIESYLSIHIHHYAEVNFAGFQQMVDALDGVPIWFDTPVRDVRSGLNIVDAGCHLLDGPQALAYARARSLETLQGEQWVRDGTGDLGRMTRQRAFVSQVAATASAKVSLRQIFTLDRLMAAAAENMVVGDSASWTDLGDLARTFADGNGGRFTSHALPVADRVTSGGAQVLQLREAEAQTTLDLFRDPGEPPPGPFALSEDGTVPSSKAGAVVAASAEELASYALPGVSRQACSEIDR